MREIRFRGMSRALHKYQDWLVSTKIDGWNMRWTGSRLLTKGGHVMQAPDWFIARLPPIPLDGELYIPGKTFAAVATLRAHRDHPWWQKARFAVFDAPGNGTLTSRLARVRTVLGGAQGVFVLPQRRFLTTSEAASHIRRLVAGGEEGVVLADPRARHGDSRGRVKIKGRSDHEGVVVGYRLVSPSEFASLRVRGPDGRVFSLGIGFKAGQRRVELFPVGAVVKFSHEGLVSYGRGARFMGMRHADDMNMK